MEIDGKKEQFGRTDTAGVSDSKVGCSCLMHRYRVAHICWSCAEVFPHSQASMDQHRSHFYTSFPSKEWKHGYTFEDMRSRLSALDQRR